MAKFHGDIGFAEQYNSKPGVWSEQIVEKEYYGEVPSNYFSARDTSETTNDELTLNNQISIIANKYAFENFQFIKYVVYMGVKWRITKVDVQYPRLILSIGGVYNA